LQRNAGIEPTRVDEILRSHLVDPAGLRVDDFDRFFKAWAEALLERIERATGNVIAREAVEKDVPEPVDYEIEETEVASRCCPVRAAVSPGRVRLSKPWKPMRTYSLV